MKNKEFEAELTKALEARTEGISPSPFLLQKIKSEAESMSRKETLNMKFFNVKKIAIVCAFCLAVSATCFATMKLSGSVSHSTKEFTSIESVANYAEKLGFTPKYVASFDNGFTFMEGGTGETNGLDSEGNPTGKTYQTLNLTYRNDADKWVSLNIKNGNPYVDAGQGYEEGYSSNVYKFVPPDYELTAEDIKAQEDGSMYISYGSSEVEINIMENYSWQDNGLYYSLTSADCDFGEEEMAHMAEQIMAD